MASLLGLTILSTFITSILLVPFIDFLYKIKLRRRNQETKDMFNKRTFFFDKFHAWKVGTPVGGGALIILVVSILTMWSYGILGISVNPWTIAVILIAFIGFGLLGLYDDFKKMSGNGSSFWGLRFRHKFLIQWLIAFVIASIFYYALGYHFIFIRGIGLASLGFLFIPIAAFIIVAFANAFNITDGLDGLSSGLFLICLAAFLAIASSRLDTYLGVFIAILMGSVGAFLYFNIYKARIWLGDVGSLSLGASLAVIGILSGKIIAVVVIGGVFVLEVASSLIQLISKKYFGRRVFPVAPLHLYLQKRGWEEPKIVMRAWLLGFFFAVLGLYLALVR
jgi:phospho-N-acetylmuramoyl-pentapeptide-transferase